MASVGGLRPEFVGRQVEVDRLGLMLGAVAAGRSRAVLIEGEAGIGKTRLAAEMADCAVGRGFRVVWGRADLLTHDRPFGPLLNALDVRLDSTDPQRTRLASLLASSTGAVAPAIGANVPELRYLVIEGLSGLVERLAHDEPLLLIIEDLHWADESTLQTLVGIVDRTVDIPLMVVTTSRASPRPTLVDRFVDALVAAGAARWDLRPLDHDAAQRLAEEVLGAPPDPQLRRMVARAGGNPLFVVELAESARTGRPVRHGTVGAERFRVRALERIRELGDHTVVLVQAGSLLGDGFSLREVTAVSGLAMTSLMAAVEEARRAGILVDREATLAFRHELLREAVYEAMPPATRGELHRRAGQALAAMGAPPGRVARHVTLGAEPGDPTAVAWLHRAARQAGASAPAAALDLVRQALALVAPDDPARHQLLAEEVELLGWTGQLDECETLARQVLLDATDSTVRAALHRHLALCLFLRNQAHEAATVCDASTAEQVDAAGRARSQSEAALAYLAAANPDVAAERASAAVQGATEVGDAGTVCLGELVLSRLDAYELDFAGSLRRSETAMAAAAKDTTGSAAHQQPAFFHLLTLLNLERFDDAARELAGERRRVMALGTTWAVPLYHGVAAVLKLLTGDLHDARAESIAGLASADDVGSSLATIWLHAANATIALHAGDDAEAERAIATAKELMLVQTPLLGLDLLVLAEASLQESRGDRRAALQTLMDAWQLFEAIGMGVNNCILGPDVARLTHVLHDEPTLAATAAWLHDVAATTGLAGDIGAACLARGLHDGDVDALLEGVAAYERSGRRLALARCCEAAAQVLWSKHARREAGELLNRSYALYEGAGADGSVRRVAGLFSALGLRRPRPRTRPTTGWHSLTASERRIAALVADGLNNQAIADRLAISRRTVETHLSHVYAKLGIGTRVELALEAKSSRMTV